MKVTASAQTTYNLPGVAETGNVIPGIAIPRIVIGGKVIVVAAAGGAASIIALQTVPNTSTFSKVKEPTVKLTVLAILLPAT